MTTRARYVRPAVLTLAVALLAACSGGTPATHGDAAGSIADGVRVEVSTVPPATGCGSPVVGP